MRTGRTGPVVPRRAPHLAVAGRLRPLVLTFLVAVLSATSPCAAQDDLVGHGGPVKAVVVSADGARALTGSFDYSMILWDLSDATPKELQGFDAHDGAVNDVEFLPGGRAASAGDDGSVGLWDLRTGALLTRFTGHSHKVVGIAVNRDGNKAASVSWDRTARLWDLTERRPGPVLKGHRNILNDAAFSIDGRRLFTAGSDGVIRQWRVSDGKAIGKLHDHGWGINAVAALPDGERLLFGAIDGFVGILDIGTGRIVRRLRPFERPALSLAVDARFGLVAAGSGGGRISVWETEGWKEKFTYEHSFGPIWTLAFPKDGKSLYFGGLDDDVILWRMEPARPFEPARGKYPRRFQVTEGMAPGALHFARKCSVCHTLTPDTANRAGPSLFKLFGRKAGTLPDYPYSEALKGGELVWTERTVDALFAEGPDVYVPGTKMPLQKMNDPEERKALIAFLKHATETGRPAHETYVSYGTVRKKE